MILLCAATIIEKGSQRSEVVAGLVADQCVFVPPTALVLPLSLDVLISCSSSFEELLFESM